MNEEGQNKNLYKINYLHGEEEKCLEKIKPQSLSLWAALVPTAKMEQGQVQ